MALVIPDGYGQVLFNISNALDPEPYVITFGVLVDDPTGNQLVTETIGGLCREYIKPLMDSSYSYGPTTLRTLSGGEMATYVDTDVDPGTGTASSSLPANCAILVHKRTARGGRGGRGRFYIPGVFSEDVDDAGRLALDYQADVQTQMSGLLTELNDSGNFLGDAPGMWLLHDSESPGSLAPNQITSLQVDRVIATQRRRLRK